MTEMLISKMSLQKPDEDNMNPSHSETTQQSLEMKKERATRKQQKRVDIDAILNLMSKEIRGKLLIPNVHMDAIYIRSLFSGSDRALIGSQPSRRCATGSRLFFATSADDCLKKKHGSSTAHLYKRIALRKRVQPCSGCSCSDCTEAR